MTRVFQPASADEHAAFVVTHCDRCTRCDAKGCEILEAVTVNHETDPDYPGEWIRDDDGRPTCTDFLPREVEAAAVIQDAVPDRVAPAIAEVEVVETRVVGRGVIDACRLAGKRALTVPYADVAALFGGEAEDMRATLGVPAPAKARVHRGKVDVTITARSLRDGASVTASVRLKVRRTA